ncbi:uncharacterized protein PITG_10943 [Phytophthora infestans T30-4]|uniref:Uncharacterized protein n=1 Tax=Phytophthora infestans (strain T30-4) TaxID=403677 RepID=D0NFT4_PHYIT|nr:uncharacterized protein PITG_10943 [Phytophthora infestans T30-4]EEY57135.1 conserved hypothetical protein [Phytophthora infestans T30-4]|eukprot:XP_002901745.1 conserved hypothetical protein [Phytophthora infestans T30-4]
MRVIVGSTLSPRLIVAHLDVSDRMEWTASLSGELELPSTHVCRGIYLAERSPFADVASTEKRKRATFFHAAATNEPVPIYLSKFKLILEKMAAMQTQLNVRFDDVDKMLLQLSARVEQLERNGGTSAR